MPKPEPKTSEGASFEEALQQLEAIVEQMESGALPLEDLMTQFEAGTRLAKICQARLAQAETKIQLLEKNASGDLTLRPVQTSD